MTTILYLSDDDVRRCQCTPAQMNDALEDIFTQKHHGRAQVARELSMPDDKGNKYAGKGGVMAQPALASIKWYGYFGSNIDRRLPVFNPLIILNEGECGLPIAIMNGDWISQMRTASITAVAAKHMARPDSRRIAFIGCGQQARSHLNALRATFPLDHVNAYSRTIEGARRFADEVVSTGLTADAFDDPRKVVEGCDIVISAVPRLARNNGFMDATWLPEGVFVGAMDLGYSWQGESLLALDRVITDDLQAVTAGETLKLNYPGTFEAGLAEVVTGNVRGRLSAAERNGIVFAGTGLADTAAAAMIYRLAREQKLGTTLPL